MNRLGEHILHLLFEYDFVIVPKLGGFVVNRVDAVSKKNGHQIRTPHYMIGFNAALTHNDGLLPQSYSKNLSVSFQEAELLLQQDVEKLKKEITEKGFFYIEKCGKLYLDQNNEDKICFIGIENKDFNRPEVFGLTDVVLQTAEEILHEKEETLERKKKFTFNHVAKFISISIAAAALFFGISLPISTYYNESENIQKASFFPSEDANLSIKEGSIRRNSYNDNKSTKFQETSTQSDPTPLSKDVFYVIVGTFQTTNVAKHALDRYKSDGFNNAGIVSSHTAKRIFIAQFSTMQEATKYLSKFVVQNPLNKDAWVYKLRESDKINS